MHNANFDISFLKEKASQLGYSIENPYVDTAMLAKGLRPDLVSYTLDKLAETFEMSLAEDMRAVDVAETTAELYMHLLQIAEKKGISTWEEFNALWGNDLELRWKMPVRRMNILAVNATGRKNLYKLLEEATENEKDGKLRVTRSFLQQHREGLLLGSGNERSELFRAIVERRRDEDIERIIDFFDYLEIQPVANSRYIIKEFSFMNLNSEEDIRECNRRIVEWGIKKQKPVIADCDLYFLRPEDKNKCHTLVYGTGYMQSTECDDWYFRTTEEMLEEFFYLGKERAEEVVITNTRTIADMVESVITISEDDRKLFEFQ